MWIKSTNEYIPLTFFVVEHVDDHDPASKRMWYEKKLTIILFSFFQEVAEIPAADFHPSSPWTSKWFGENRSIEQKNGLQLKRRKSANKKINFATSKMNAIIYLCVTCDVCDVTNLDVLMRAITKTMCEKKQSLKTKKTKQNNKWRTSFYLFYHFCRCHKQKAVFKCLCQFVMSLSTFEFEFIA